MANYPEWVKKHRVKGTAVKKVGNKYYLYKHTSKYVKGKKYPQCVDKYLGVITPDGVIYSSRKNVSMENILVYEYGFSKSVLSLCPDEWKKTLGDDWYPVLLAIIAKYSPESYLLVDENACLSENKNIELHEKKLLRYFDMNELLNLKTIYLLVFENRSVLSKIGDDQKTIAEKYSIDLEAA